MSYASWVQGSALLGAAQAPDTGFDQVRSAFSDLAAAAIEKVLAGDAEGVQIVTCLQKLASNPVMAAHLAAKSAEPTRPEAALPDYLRTFCASPAGSPYSRGKQPLSQGQVAALSGDIVIEKGMVWLAQDHGVEGDDNGRIDPGEVFQIKLGLLNRSDADAWAASTVTLISVDSKRVECSPPGFDPLSIAQPPASDQPPAGVKASAVAGPAAANPQECKLAAVLTPTAAAPELSPAERSTVGPFQVQLSSTAAAPYTVSLLLKVQDVAGRTSTSLLTIPVEPVPSVTLDGIKVDDDLKGGSKGNGNGAIEPGEQVELSAGLSLTGRDRVAQVSVKARQYSPFLAVEERNVGLPELIRGKRAPIAAPFKFTVPTVAEMGGAVASDVNVGFFTDRRVTLWLAGSACAGKGKIKKAPATAPADGYLCPAGFWTYRFIQRVDLPVVFGQVFLVSTVPAGASLYVNERMIATSLADRPVVFTEVSPVKNTIVYYTLSAEKAGYLPTAVTIPVIEKDQSANDLTVAYALELEPPPPPPLLPIDLPPLPPVEAALPPPDMPTAAAYPPEDFQEPGPMFALSAGFATRVFFPRLDSPHDPSGRESASLDTGHVPVFTGIEAGGSWYLWKGLFLGLSGQALFSANDPAASLKTPGSYKTFYYTSMGAEVPSITLLSAFMGPGYRFDFGRFGLDVSAGYQIDGVLADDVLQYKDGAKSDYTSVETLNMGARGELSFLYEVAEGWYPFVQVAAVLPAELVDLSSTIGIEYRYVPDLQ